MTLRRWFERARASLFYVPVAFAIGAIVLAQAMLLVDTWFVGIPDALTATVDSARGVLSVIAGATLTFAAISFSVSLLLIASSSSQYSPRVVSGLFRDPFNKRVMGIVVGTFIYCLVVLRAVRGPLEDGGTAAVPSISVLVAVLLGLVALLSIIAFIDHGAHSMEVSTILRKVTGEALKEVQRTPAEGWGDDAIRVERTEPPFDVRFIDYGWVQTIDHDALLAELEPGGLMVLATATGSYAQPASLACRIWPQPADGEAMRRGVLKAIVVGDTRTLQDDESYGIRQLADVALKALSPGINDPTTAYDALAHMATVLGAILARPPRGRILAGAGDRHIVDPASRSDEETIRLAFDEARVAAMGAPTVIVYLLDVIRSLIDALSEAERPGAVAELRRQATLVLQGSANGELLPADRERVQRAYELWFTQTTTRDASTVV